MKSIKDILKTDSIKQRRKIANTLVISKEDKNALITNKSGGDGDSYIEYYRLNDTLSNLLSKYGENVEFLATLTVVKIPFDINQYKYNLSLLNENSITKAIAGMFAPVITGNFNIGIKKCNTLIEVAELLGGLDVFDECVTPITADEFFDFNNP